MRSVVHALSVLLVVAACTAQRAEPAPPADLVFFASGTGITVVDGGGAVISTDATVASSDWHRLYAVRGSELVTLDPATNRELATTTVPRGLTARVVSTSRNLVALAESGTGAYQPSPRERTRIVVADPTGAAPARELNLPGNFEPEAFAADDAYLFVLEYLPANAPERYRVRRVELATGQVQPLLSRDKTLIPAGAEEEMRGEGRQAVLSPDRSRLYTLYLHQADHQHTRDLLPGTHATGGPPVHAFVHILSLTEGWAYCLDLPTPFGEHPADRHALSVSPDGTRLYVGELTTKQVAVADTANLTIARVATLIDDQPAGHGATMTVSPDGATLYIGSANVLRRVDTSTLQVRDTWPTPDLIRGMAVHPGGDQLLLGQPDHITRIDATTGKVLDTFTAADLRTVYTSRDRW
jgi:DNA-binding beta-propeller fold protein YncE